MAMRRQGAGQGASGTERRWVGRAVRQAPAAAAALRARVAKALAQLEALRLRGRGKKRVAAVSAFRQAVVAMGQRYGVEPLVWFRLPPHPTPRPVCAYRGRPARIAEERQATVEVWGEAVAGEAAVRRVGGRVDGTHHPRASLSLAPAVVAYRRAYLVERSGGRLTGRPRALPPRDGQRDDPVTGRMRLLSIALRVLTLWEWVGRRPWTTDGAKRAGL